MKILLKKQGNMGLFMFHEHKKPFEVKPLEYCGYYFETLDEALKKLEEYKDIPISATGSSGSGATPPSTSYVVSRRYISCEQCGVVYIIPMSTTSSVKEYVCDRCERIEKATKKAINSPKTFDNKERWTAVGSCLICGEKITHDLGELVKICDECKIAIIKLKEK